MYKSERHYALGQQPSWQEAQGRWLRIPLPVPKVRRPRPNLIQRICRAVGAWL